MSETRMILNMHIRLDYARWGVLDKPKARTTTLCGKITAPKYAGVPGINYEASVCVSNGDYGWCLECCAEFIRRTDSSVPNIENELLAALYNNARYICVEQLKLATSPK